MPATFESLRSPVLTLPDAVSSRLSIRAKALLFQDARSAELLDRVERIARSEASVLVTGETGTGKELIARHLHAQSGRSGPFLAVNCGAFSETLVEAELFGHEAGAFTGATQARPGWFEAADGGTLFLDEIGDLPLAQQVKLLRVLQERQVVRLGSRRPIPVDVRLIAATHVDLRDAVASQRFRADLYYRLVVAGVEVPPLRERSGDILPLARHFIERYGPRLAPAGASLADDAQAALLAYSWPGNIRELENIIHFALIVCRHGVVRAADLKLVQPAAVADARAVDAAPVPAADASSPASTQLRQGIDALLRSAAPAAFHQVEAALVRSAFGQAGENQVRAARLLGVTRNTMRTLLKRHGLLVDAPAPAAAGAARPDASIAL